MQPVAFDSKVVSLAAMKPSLEVQTIIAQKKDVL